MQVATVRSNEVIFRRGEELSRYPATGLAEQAKSEMPAALAYQCFMLTPAPHGDIVIKLTRLSLHFWQPERPKEHIQAIIEDYVEDLAHLPSDILEETIRAWRRTGEWFPKISHLLEIAEPQLRKRRDELRKLESVAAVLDAGPLHEPPPKTEEEKARVSELVKETVAGLKAASESSTHKSTRRINPSQPLSEDAVCQRRSKIRPVGRSKTRPLGVMRYAVLRFVPVVHGRDPRCFV